ncbi:MAG: tRNA adenosine(34) deaminase TadA [Gammaproteobacteria bacterium]|nr:MAG: tRNA adenosine(34) deaminase TadA [Gammaproteobacteria bacterium]
MQHALALAEQAAAHQEVPVGAVLVYQGEIVAGAYNRPIHAADPTSHAEIECLRLAAKKFNNYRLPDTTLYVTLEPCAMCAGALVHARVREVVFGAYDQKAGAVTSVFQLIDQNIYQHRCAWRGGLLEAECRTLLQSFFRERRKQKLTNQRSRNS